MITWSRHACRTVVLCLAFALTLSAPAEAATKLAAPTRIAISVTTSSAAFSWAKVTNAKTYRVCLQTSKAATSCFKTGRTTATKATFTGLKPTGGTDYFVSITAERDAATTRSELKGFNLKALPAGPSTPRAVSQKIGASTAAIAWSKATGATSYAVCLLTSATATTCTQFSRASASTTAAFSGLVPTGGTDYYYRIISYNAAAFTASPTYSFDLPVAALDGLAAKSDGKQHIVLTWTAATNASAYGIQLSTGKAMTTGVLNVSAASTTYTSSALKPGTTYYFRVRGLNSAVQGAFSSTGQLRFGTSGTTVRVVSYNLCGQNKCVTSANKIKTWGTRKPLAGAIVRSTNADIVATQESTTTDTNFGNQLPGYKMSHYKSAKSLFYKASKYTLVSSGEITLNSSLKKYAVWADLKDIATGTRFIVADVHLVSGKGKSNDDERTRETTILINAIKKINPSGLPVIYAGDYNSNASNAKQSNYKGGYDAPLRVFNAAGIVDSFAVSKASVNQTWNSANQARNPPLKSSHHVDHIFTSPDIRTLAWYALIRLSGASYSVPFASDHNPIAADLAVPGR